MSSCVWFVRRENGIAKDWIPFFMRPNCDRSYFNSTTGKDESLLDAMERYASHGYYPEKDSPWKEKTENGKKRAKKCIKNRGKKMITLVLMGFMFAFGMDMQKFINNRRKNKEKRNV